MRALGFKLSLLSAITVCLILASIITGYFSHSQIKEQVEARLINNIQHSLHAESKDISILFDRAIGSVTELAALYKENQYSSDHEKHVASAARIGGVSKITLGFNDGRSYVSKSSESFPNGVGILEKYDPRTRPWYQKGKSQNGLSLSDVFFTKSDGTPMIGVMHSVANGVVMADIRFSNLQKQLENMQYIDGASGIIVDKQGTVLASTATYATVKDNLRNSLLSDVSTHIFGQSHTNIEGQIDGIDTLFVSQKIPLVSGDEWYLIVSIDKEVAYAPVAEATWKMAIIIFMTGLFTLLIMLFALNRLYQPIHSLRTLVDDLSHGEGDLTQRLKVESNDDLGQIATSINAFISKLQQMLIEIQSATSLLTARVDNLHVHSRSSSEILATHTEETTQIVTAVEELSHTALQVVDHSQAASSSTQEAHENTQTANNTIGAAQGRIQTLSTEIQETSHNVQNMNNETTSIQSIVEVIGGIADQTNLLALNASIEAARAGEQGRGFAVVADEVRALASRTQSSTTEIEHALSKLKQEAEMVVTSINSTQKTCDKTVEEAQEVSVSLNALNVNITGVNDLNTQISTSASEQNTVIQTISENIHHIHAIVEKLNAEGQNLHSETQEIAKVNQNLTALLNQFKL